MVELEVYKDKEDGPVKKLRKGVKGIVRKLKGKGNEQPVNQIDLETYN